MTHRFFAGLVQSLLSLRTLIAVVAIGAYGLVTVAAGTGLGPEINAWDVMTPALTDSTTVVIIGLSWWLSWLIPEVLRVGQCQRLIRSGSARHAVCTTLAFLAGCLTTAVVLVGLVFLAEGACVGLSTRWSGPALHFTDGTPSAFSAPGLARFFANPVLAVIATTLYAAMGFLILAAAVLAIAARGHGTAASANAISIVLWVTVCSFSPLPIPVGIDASLTVSLGWALVTPGGLGIAAIWWTFGLAATFLLTFRPARRHVLALVSGRAFSTTALLCLAGLGVLNAATHSPGQGMSTPAAFFAGAYGDVASYVLVAAVPLAFATGFIARIADAAEGPLLYQALRRGSYRRWLSTTFRRELGWAAGTAIGIGIVVTIGTLVTERTVGSNDAVVLATGTAGLLAAMILCCALAAMMVWAPLPPSTVWPIVVGCAFIGGYAVPSGLGWLNVVAPYGFPVDTFRPAVPLAATICTLLTAIGIFSVTSLRTISAHTDQFA